MVSTTIPVWLCNEWRTEFPRAYSDLYLTCEDRGTIVRASIGAVSGQSKVQTKQGAHGPHEPSRQVAIGLMDPAAIII
jgi:hypothetical protein